MGANSGSDGSRAPSENPARRILRRLPRRIGHRWLLAAGVLAALALRLPLLPHESFDYMSPLSDWYAFIVANGYFASLQHGFYHYNPPYLYLLTTIAYAAPGLPDLFAIKFVSLAFEAPLAFLVHRCVRLRRPDSGTLPALAALAVLFAPTVVLNGSFWAQCDVIHTTLLVACFFFLLKKRPAAAGASFGLAFAVKAQALFFLPALFWIAAAKEKEKNPGGDSAPASFPVRAILPAPLAYFLALLPAWLLGRPAYDLLLVYLGQAAKYPDLVKDAPNLYQWLPNDWYAFWPLGVLATVGAVWGVTVLVRRSRALPTADLPVTLAAFALILAPYLLPKMHDRFFFAADVFTVLLAFYRPKFWYAPIAMGLASANSYYTGAFLRDAPVVPLAWAAVVPLLLLVALGRQLLRDLGYEVRPKRLGAWARREFHRRKAAAAPLALLLPVLGGMFLFAWQGGRFSRPVSDDPVAAGTLARAASLNAEHYFVRFSHRTLEADSAVAYHLDGGGAPGGDLALRVVTGHFAGDGAAQRAAARVLMALFFFGAALLAYLSLARLLERRGSALAAVLLVFSWFWAGSGDAVAAEGPPALFGIFLAFHGLVVFSQEGRLRPALVRCGAATGFSFAAPALILAFLLLSAYERRRRPTGEGEGEAPPAGLRRGFDRRSDRRLRALAGFGVAFAGALWGLGALNTRALLAGEGAREGSSVAGSSLLAEPEDAGAGAGFPGGGLLGVGSVFVPGGESDPAGPGGGAAFVLGLLLTLVGVVGAARSRRRVPFLALAFLGFLPGFAAGGAAAAPEVGRLAHLGLVLVVVSLGLDALRRLRGEWPGRAAAGAAFGIALLLGYRGADARPDPGTTAREARIGEDFERIRRALQRRGAGAAVFVPEDPFRSLLDTSGDPGSPSEAAVFVPEAPFRGEEFAGGRAAAWYLAGFVLAGERNRTAAEYLLEDEPGAGPGLLAAGTREVFLHHRAAYDGELGARIEAAGAPRLSFEYQVYLAGGRLLYVREDCAPEDREGDFVLHLLPRDEDDLPPWRKIYGFDNLSFRFEDRALDTSGACVAEVRLPDYDLRTIVTGRFLRTEGRLTPVWRGEFDPSARPGGPEQEQRPQ